jgi:mRNA interferase MazF
MRVGTMALAQVQQADGRIKPRPVVVLQEMPPYRDLLVCAVSSQRQGQRFPNDDC